MIKPIKDMKNAFDLTGQTALITGGNRGLGLGIGLAMAQCGADVAILCRDSKKAQEALEELRPYGGKMCIRDRHERDGRSCRGVL